jgi:hypothetical protein
MVDRKLEVLIITPLYFVLHSVEKITQLNRLLGSVVNNILEIVAEPEPVHEAACIPTVPIRIALFGKPCSGKSTIAKDLCEKFGLHLVSIDELVETSIM